MRKSNCQSIKVITALALCLQFAGPVLAERQVTDSQTTQTQCLEAIARLQTMFEEGGLDTTGNELLRDALAELAKVRHKR